MLGARIVVGRKNRDDGEKPFWISFADLMSALMVLFLLVMSVALLAVTKNVTEAERKKAEREQEIEQLLAKIERATEQYPGISIDKSRNVISFGDRAQFATGSSQLTEAQAGYLRKFVPEVLVIARDKLGMKWVKRIVVEGYTDQTGSYLFNLNLSLQRSQRVLCVLLTPPTTAQQALAQEDREQIRDLFLVGGFSFNSAKESLAESRRIELRLEFFGLDEARSQANDSNRNNFGVCQIERQ